MIFKTVTEKNFNILDPKQSNEIVNAQAQKGLTLVDVNKCHETPDTIRLNVTFSNPADPKKHEKFSQKFDNFDAFIASYNRVQNIKEKLAQMAAGTYKQRGRKSQAQIDAEALAKLNADKGKEPAPQTPPAKETEKVPS